MNLRLRFSFFLFITLLVSYCTSSEPQQQEAEAPTPVEEANAIEEDLESIEESMTSELEALINLKNSINVQGKALTVEEMKLVEAIDAIQNSYALYETNKVSMDESTDQTSKSGNVNERSTSINLTEDQLLALQKESKDSLLMIKHKLEILKKDIEGLGIN